MVVPVNTYPVNPIAFIYGSEVGIQAYFGKTAGLVTSRGNDYDPVFTAARQAGARVLAYVDAMEAPLTNSSALDTALYGPSGTAPHWPYKDANGNYRVNFAGDYMTDITVGSTWSNQVVAYCESLMHAAQVDGVMMDVLGSQLWSALAAWSTWPAQEQQAWVAGAVNILQRLDMIRRRVNPRFLIVNNNTWLQDALGKQGMSAVNGWVLEHHTAFDVNGNLTGTAVLAGLPTAPGLERYMVAIATTQAEALNWVKVPGITNVSSQAGYATAPPPPPVPFFDLGLTKMPMAPGGLSVVGALGTLGVA